MEKNTGSKIWLWLVLLLVACNIALLATIGFKPGNSMSALHMPPPHRGYPGANFNKQLNFTSEQNEQFTQMRIAQRAKIDSIKKMAKNVREQFFASLNTGLSNPAQLDSIGNLLGNYHKQIELQTYAHFSEVRAMLTDKQKVIFDSIIVDVLRKLPEQPRFKGDGMQRHHPGDGPPPHGEGFHPPPHDDGPPPGEDMN